MEAAVPVAVYYSLTDKGRELTTVLAQLGDWAKRWDDPVPDGATGRLRE
jgi:DNA-binding HxlR family transcriptional regulator